jgi:hypothetical protein
MFIVIGQKLHQCVQNSPKFKLNSSQSKLLLQQALNRPVQFILFANCFDPILRALFAPAPECQAKAKFAFDDWNLGGLWTRKRD